MIWLNSRGFVSASSSNDFEREGLDASKVLQLEAERLEEQPVGSQLQVRDYLVTASKFAELCGGLEVSLRKRQDLKIWTVCILKVYGELEVEMFGKQGNENSLSVDEVLEVYERRSNGAVEETGETRATRNTRGIAVS